jgi:dTDP-4-amino-4,6-dideoxygalactose transaminase
MAFEIKRKAWHRVTAERVKLLAGAARIVSASAKPQMKVPFLDLKAHHAPLIGKFDRAIRQEQFLSLPMFPELTTEQTEYVACCVSEAVGVEALV